jgi:hypothetical protein
LIAKRESQLNRAKYTWWLVCQTNFHRYANSTWTVLVGFSFVGGQTMKPSLVDFSRRSTTLLLVRQPVKYAFKAGFSLYKSRLLLPAAFSFWIFFFIYVCAWNKHSWVFSSS